jgi:hypothetical protein
MILALSSDSRFSVLSQSKLTTSGETSHFETEALVTTDKLAKAVGRVWNTRVGLLRLGDLGRAERTGHGQ